MIKNRLGINFHSQPIYENKYLKAKVKEFNGNIKKTSKVIMYPKKILTILALLL